MIILAMWRLATNNSDSRCMAGHLSGYISGSLLEIHVGMEQIMYVRLIRIELDLFGSKKAVG